jgi:hypothetical protein
MTHASSAANGPDVGRVLLRVGHLVHSGATLPWIESGFFNLKSMDLPNCFGVAYFLGHKVSGIDFCDALLTLLDLFASLSARIEAGRGTPFRQSRTAWAQYQAGMAAAAAGVRRPDTGFWRAKPLYH